MAVRAGSTFAHRRDNNPDQRKEDNVMVVIVLACAGNHGVLIVAIISIAQQL
jgi:hypothetical protein